MPFYDPDVVILPSKDRSLDRPEELDPTMGDLAVAAFQTDNLVTNIVRSIGAPDPLELEDGYDGIKYFEDNGMAEFIIDGAKTFNRKAGDYRIAQIKEEQLNKRITDAGGWRGLVATFVAGTIDGPSLASLGGLMAGVGRGAISGAARTGMAAGIDAAATEAGLHNLQATRTAEESMGAIGGSVLLGAALGSLAGRYSRAEQRAMEIKLENAMYGEQGVAQVRGLGSSTVGAAASETGPLKLKDENIISSLPVIRSQDPLIRSQLSELDSARTAGRELAETPLEYEENALGVATVEGGAVETRVKMWSAPLAQTVEMIDGAFAKYYTGLANPNTKQRMFLGIRSEVNGWRGGEQLTLKRFREEVGRAAYSGDKHIIPEVQEAAQAYRQFDDLLKKAAQDTKLLPEEIQAIGDVSHLFRMYNREKIITGRDEFFRILKNHFDERQRAAEVELHKVEKRIAAKANDLPTTAQINALREYTNILPGELDDLVNQTINTILGNASGRIPYDSITSGARGPLKSRLLNIASERIADFLDTDIEAVMRAQVGTMAPDIEIARKFGDVHMTDFLGDPSAGTPGKIDIEADRKIAAIDGKEGISDAEKSKLRKKIEQARKEAKRDIAAMRDRIKGNYKLPDNPDGIVIRVGRVARTINYTRLLGAQLVSAFADPAGIVFQNGLLSTFKDGFIPLVTNFKAFRAAADEVKAAGTALDMILDSRALELGGVLDDYGRGSKFERGVQTMGEKFGVVSLMAPWNAGMKQFGGMVTMTNMLRAIERVSTGAAQKGDVRRLAQSGINEEMARRIWLQFAGGKREVGGEHLGIKDGISRHSPSTFEEVPAKGKIEDGVYLANAGDWDDMGATEAFRAAVVRDVDKQIITPGQDKPLWMSTELGKTVGQFRSFMFASMQRITLAQLQQRDARTLSGVMTGLALGGLVYVTKQIAAGRDVSDDPRVWAAEMIDKSGQTGWLMDVNNLLEKFTRGRVGLSAITGEQMSRYQSRNVLGAFLGPTPGALEDIAQVSGSIFAGDFNRSDLHKVRQLIPFQNLAYLRRLFDQVENASSDVIGLENKKN